MEHKPYVNYEKQKKLTMSWKCFKKWLRTIIEIAWFHHGQVFLDNLQPFIFNKWHSMIYEWQPTNNEIHDVHL
jgi:hypothetical protein